MIKLIVQLSKGNDMDLKTIRMPIKDNDTTRQISKQQYEFALNRIEELLPLVTDETPPSDKNAIELTIVSDVVETYEKIHYPIAKPTIGELISISIEEKGMTQKQLAKELGISPSRVNDYISGRAEPTLRIARGLCLILGIAPAAILGI
jgi:hypothetical protein